MAMICVSEGAPHGQCCAYSNMAAPVKAIVPRFCWANENSEHREHAYATGCGHRVARAVRCAAKRSAAPPESASHSMAAHGANTHISVAGTWLSSRLLKARNAMCML